MSSHLFSTAVLLCWAHVGPSWAFVGHMLAPRWAHAGPSWAYVAHDGPVLALWLGMLGDVWAMLGQVLGHVGPSWPC